MSEYADFDLDRSVSRAWRTFQASLADHLVAMTDEDSLVVEVVPGEEPTGGSAPYVQFAGFGGDHVRGEVSSNRYLAPEHQLDEARQDALLRQGWEAPDESANFFVQLPTTDGDRLAVMAVRALRDVFDVPHPAFLATDNPDVAGRLGLVGAPPEADPRGDEPLATVPESAEHLQQLVDDTLTPLFGHVPAKDEDGDIPVPYNSTLVFIRVHKDEPLIDIFGCVVTSVTDLDAAHVEAGILNRDIKFIKFFVAGDNVVAQLQIPCYPFSPHVLRNMLHFMSNALDEIDDDLALRTGGRRAIEEVESGEYDDPAGDPSLAEADEPELPLDEPSGLHPVLSRIARLDPEERAALAPESVADSCDGDAELIRALLHRASEAEIDWRRAAEAAVFAGDQEEAAVYEHEVQVWEQTTHVLRRALRFVARGR
jgi:hypothetical protein